MVKKIFNHYFILGKHRENLRFASNRKKPEILVEIIHNAQEIMFVIK